MKSLFYIIIKMQALDGIVDYSRFFIGDQKDFAKDLFDNLNGHPDTGPQFILRMDLIEEVSPASSVLLNSKACNLEELTENCRLITKEAFKHFNLEI